MRVMAIYFDSVGPKIADLNVNKFSREAVEKALGNRTAKLLAIVEVDNGCDYDKQFYNESLNHECAIMLQKSF